MYLRHFISKFVVLYKPRLLNLDILYFRRSIFAQISQNIVHKRLVTYYYIDLIAD